MEVGNQICVQGGLTSTCSENYKAVDYRYTDSVTTVSISTMKQDSATTYWFRG